MDQDDNGRTYDNEKNGSIFLNERKTEDWHSDFRGNIVVEGVEYYINGYKNVSKDGLTPYIKIQLKEKLSGARTAATKKLIEDTDFSEFGL